MRGLFGLPSGPAAVCGLGRRTADALGSIRAEALEHVREAPDNVDETGWLEGRSRACLRTAVADGLGVLIVATSRSRDAFADLMGRSPPVVVTSDRCSAYPHLPAARRQACWATCVGISGP